MMPEIFETKVRKKNSRRKNSWLKKSVIWGLDEGQRILPYLEKWSWSCSWQSTQMKWGGGKQNI